MTTPHLHRVLVSAMALAAVGAFIAGAGLAAPAVLAAVPLLALTALGSPTPTLLARLELPWRVAALALAARAVWVALVEPSGVILPMVDLLLFLMCGEAIRRRDATSDARLFSLSLALLVAAAAYRPGPAFAPAFLAFIVLATTALATGHVRRQAELHGARPPHLGTPFLLRIGLFSVVAVAVGLLVFAVFPRHARGWAGRPPEPARTVVGFSDEVGIGAHGATLESDPTVVLRVEFPDGRPDDVPLYWRGRSYDRFDGRTWSRSTLPRPLPPLRPRGGERLRQRIHATPLPTPVVFGLAMPVEARPRARLTIYRDEHGDLRYAGRGVVPAYEITSRIDRPAAESLRELPLAVPPGGAWFLQLPPISARVRALADSVTAGAAGAYERAAALERWLRSEFTYTLELPATAGQATLDHFLFERRAGHCEYFSTAMVVLLRAVGVPARNVNGFLGGQWNPYGDYLVVTQNEAHSWVEVWFPGEGWLTFDPTPSAGPAQRIAAGRLSVWRRMLDGMTFRWGAWILDYGVDDQVALVGRALDAWTPGEAGQGGSAGRPSAGNGWTLVLAVSAMGALAAVLLFAVPRIRARPRPETAVYRALRAAYARRGWDEAPDAGPLAFARHLETLNAPGHAAAARAIRHYLAARFGPRSDTQNLERSKEAAREAKRALAAAPPRRRRAA